MKIFFDQNPFFAFSKMAKIQFLNWKEDKNCQNAISRKNFFDLFDFTSFFPGLF